jgi:hypothetical protein
MVSGLTIGPGYRSRRTERGRVGPSSALGHGLCWADSACAGEEERREGVGPPALLGRAKCEEEKEPSFSFLFLKNLFKY